MKNYVGGTLLDNREGDSFRIGCNPFDPDKLQDEVSYRIGEAIQVKIVYGGDCGNDAPSFEGPASPMFKSTKPHKNAAGNSVRARETMALLSRKKRRMDSHMVCYDGGLKCKNGE